MHSFLNGYQVTVAIEHTYFEQIKATLKVKDLNEVETRTINAIITIGGDGTILWANKYFKYGDIPPIIAFAMGTVNYMCNFSITDFANVLTKGLNLNKEKLSDYNYKLEVKSRIECTVRNINSIFSLLKIQQARINLKRRRTYLVQLKKKLKFVQYKL